VRHPSHNAAANRVRVRVTLRLAVYRQSVRLGDKPLETTSIFFQLNTCGCSPNVTSRLTRGWVCRLQLLLVSLAQSLSGPSPQNLLPHFTVSNSRLPQSGRPRPRILYPPGRGWPGYKPRHWVPFSSPPTTRRTTVEVFDPATKRDE
jgi:hypothetical protein